MKLAPFSLSLVREAQARVAGGLRLTPCEFSAPLSELTGMSIYCKRDYQQATGSFKERGARNALLTLSPSARLRGVVAASAGNHALGLAWHGRLLGISVTVVMPKSAPRVKAERCRELGARVILLSGGFAEAASFAVALGQKEGLTFIHPFEDEAVIAGQGTLALEILEQLPDFDALIVPVGGGGLLAGVTGVVKMLRPQVEIIAVEPAHAAGLTVALSAGNPLAVPVSPTLADGLAVSQIGHYTFSMVRSWIDRCVTVTEDELAVALLELAEREDGRRRSSRLRASRLCLRQTGPPARKTRRPSTLWLQHRSGGSCASSLAWSRGKEF